MSLIDDIKINSLSEAYEILKGIGVDDNLFEKAHKDGDLHPNGKWVWVSSAAGGKGDWRTLNGRTHKKHTAANAGSASSSAATAAGNSSNAGSGSAGKTKGVSEKTLSDVLIKECSKDINQSLTDVINNGYSSFDKEIDFNGKKQTIYVKLYKKDNIGRKKSYEISVGTKLGDIKRISENTYIGSADIKAAIKSYFKDKQSTLNKKTTKTSTTAHSITNVTRKAKKYTQSDIEQISKDEWKIGNASDDTIITLEKTPIRGYRSATIKMNGKKIVVGAVDNKNIPLCSKSDNMNKIVEDVKNGKDYIFDSHQAAVKFAVAFMNSESKQIKPSKTSSSSKEKTTATKAKGVPAGKKVNYDDDIVDVYDDKGKKVYSGMLDYCPFKNDDYRWNSKDKNYDLENGYKMVGK